MRTAPSPSLARSYEVDVGALREQQLQPFRSQRFIVSNQEP